MPPDLPANVNLTDERGNIDTDFDVQMQAGPAPAASDRRTRGGLVPVQLRRGIRGTINGGGPEMLFKDFNGDINLRKLAAH